MMKRVNAGRIRRGIGNSAGFWILVFSVVGLIALLIAEPKIQARAARANIQLTAGGTQLPNGQSTNQKSGELTPYPLTAIKIFLVSSAAIGGLMLVREVVIAQSLRE